ncbi:hypothetical protein V2J09_012304 [Rumex salicifolius]
MVNIRIRKDLNESPRKDVGEIDTRAPFQSVKAAASLFGDTISSSATKPAFFKKSKSQPRGGVLDKEAEFHLTQKELGRVKIQVKDAEIAANKALPDLEKAMKTLLELKDKIKEVNASKESIYEKTEALKIKSIELKEENDKYGKRDDLETHRNEYKAAAIELDAAKQELSSLRGDFESAMEAKLSTLKMEEEAQLAAKAHSNKVVHISKEIGSMKESLDQIKASISKTLEEQEKVSAEEQARRIAKEEVEKMLHGLIQEKQSQGLNGAEALELKLAEKNKEIEELKEKITQAKETLSDSEMKAYSEHNSTRKAFKKAERENQSLQEAVEGLKLKLADVGKDIAETKEKEAHEQSLARRLQEKLQELKLKFEEALASELKAVDNTCLMKTKLEKLLLEAKHAKEEATEISSGVQELERVIEGAQEIERKMEMTVKEAEEARVAEGNAQNELKILSERKNVGSAVASDDRDPKKELLREEYMALKEKVSGSKRMVAEMKVASSTAELEELKASKIAAEKNLNESLTAIAEMARATEEAFKKAESAEIARSTAVNELKRRRQEQHCS